MTSRYVLVAIVVLVVRSLAARVVSPGDIYEIDQPTWDKAMEYPDAAASYELRYELRIGYDTRHKFPWLSWEGAENEWSAEIRGASDVPTKDPALFQAGTALYLNPVGYVSPDTEDHLD